MSDRPSRGSPRIRPARSASQSGDRTVMSAESPSLKPKGSRPKRPKSRPPIRRRASANNSKLIYSVDDDIHDDVAEDDLDVLSKREKKYIEGYHDALRDLYASKRSDVDGSKRDPEARRESEAVKRVDSKRVESKRGPEGSKHGCDGSADTSKHDDDQLADFDRIDDASDDASDDLADDASTHTSSSSQTMESLNLKDRQNAINSTHPFGIKIWKPSIYKKNRSVATRAEEDIHDYDPRRPTGPIVFGVHLTNLMWSCTFGLFLCAVCFFGALSVFVFSGFAWHKSSRPYAKLLIKLGLYWLFPFGKFVLLNKDENYLDEDELDGRSLSEFHRWRLADEGRLFFAPPRRMTNSDSKPLLKDHKGRSWRDAYASMGEGPSEDQAVDAEGDDMDYNDPKVRFFGRGRWSWGRLLFFVYFYGVLQPLSFIIAFLCWLFVFTIPMANLNRILCEHVRRRPLALCFEREKDYYKNLNAGRKKWLKKSSIILCTYRCCGLHYYKYTLGGTNIFFINLLSVVVFVIVDYFVLKQTFGWEVWYTNESFLFCGCLFSIIPLAYFIGQAVASISAQSSMGVGAVINAFFSTIVEIFLYCVALNQSKGKLVEGSMIGSILGGVLLLPGLSMCGGALKRKTQRYNPRSAGVSSTMLLFAMVTMFAPSLFYQMYGAYEIRCKDCDPGAMLKTACNTCQIIQPTLILDKLYYQVLRPFSLLAALALFVAYICGLYFTLKTHASLIWASNSHEIQAAQARKDMSWRSPSVVSFDNPKSNLREYPSSPSMSTGLLSPMEGPSKRQLPATPAKASKDPESAEDEEGGGHDAPEWSNKKSSVILLGSTLLYAIIAEILVDNVDAVLSNFPINPKFLGLTVFALVPNTTEFVNAISFAVGGNVALSMEIGSAYALQVVLIQIPSLVVYSVYKGFTNTDMIFSLIFPRWDVVATLISIYLFTYIYAEGKSNYFKGVILILIYLVVLAGFYLDDVVADLEGTAAFAMKMF